MGAGASALEGGALEGVSSADAGALADTNLSLSNISPTTREIAVRLKDALCTPSGWKELQSLFKTLAADLDDAVPSHEWGQMVFENEEVRAKYFGDAGPEEIAAQFESFDTDGKSQMAFEQFVDGTMGLGVAVNLADALTVNEDLKMFLEDVFNTLQPEDDGTVAVEELKRAIVNQRELLETMTGMSEGISTRFVAFFMCGKVKAWVGAGLRRLGIDNDGRVSWDQLCAAGVRATSG